MGGKTSGKGKNMFISRKKYEEAIAKAKMETEERIWSQQRLDRIEERLERRINELEMRINSIDPKCQPVPEEKCVAPARY